MARKPDEESDVQLADDLLFSGKGLELRRFDRAETLAGRTPDFRIMREGELSAYCEIKSPRDDWLDEEIEKAPPGQIAGGARRDPTFNRIARHIEKAASQFDAVNADHALPNILVFVNHADAVSVADLHETITGMFVTDSGRKIPTLMNIAEGRIGVARTKIDLYVWIGRKAACVQGWLFNDTHPHHVATVCRLLGIDGATITR